MKSPAFYTVICLFSLFAMLLINGCASQDDFVRKSEAELDEMEKFAVLGQNLYQTGQYHYAESVFDSLHAERTVSQSQYKFELISLMLLQGQNEEAHKLLLQLKEDIDFLTDKKSEDEAKSLWHGEQKKVFKGDPFERSTLHMLLALSFLQRKDPENALAAVKSGLLFDGDTEKGEFTADYGLLQFLGAFCLRQLGDNQESDKWLATAVKNLEARGYTLVKADDGTPVLQGSCFENICSPENNTLLVLWAGTGPSMERIGEYKETRVIHPGKMQIDSLTLQGGKENKDYLFLPKLADINFQAMTRGRRLMNDITAQKAFWKVFINVTSTVCIATGITLVSTGRHPYIIAVGGGLIALGVIGYVVAYCINPTADVRNWKCLPGDFFVLPLSLSPGKHEFSLSGYLGPDQVFRLPVTLDIPDKPGMNIVHLRLNDSKFNTGYMESFTNVLRSKYFNLTANNFGKDELKSDTDFSSGNFFDAVAGPPLEK